MREQRSLAATSDNTTGGLLSAVVVLLLTLPGVAGCMEAREDVTRPVTSCKGCHGDSKSLAPPTGVWLNGKKQTTYRGVGAHRVHLAATLSAPITCKTCHTVPDQVDTPVHMDTSLPAEVTFTGLARARGVSAAWNGTQCAVYCHSGKLPGGSATRPLWTKVDRTQVTCGSCHGFPPAGAHPAAVACHLCHKGVVDSAGKITDPKKHINGKVEVIAGGGCNVCHGSAKNAAPPADTAGNTGVSFRGVGVHQAHVVAGDRRQALGCDACHLNPKSVGDKGHMDSKLPAEVIFGALASTGKLKPTWDGTALTCKNVYCHSLSGAKSPAPAWTKELNSGCDGCHGLPPTKTLSGSSHPTGSISTCYTCHKGVVDSSGKIIDTKKHINGKVDFL